MLILREQGEEQKIDYDKTGNEPEKPELPKIQDLIERGWKREFKYTRVFIYEKNAIIKCNKRN